MNLALAALAAACLGAPFCLYAQQNVDQYFNGEPMEDGRVEITFKLPKDLSNSSLILHDKPGQDEVLQRHGLAGRIQSDLVWPKQTFGCRCLETTHLTGCETGDKLK